MKDMVQVEQAGPNDFLEIARLDRVAWEQSRNSEFIPDGEHVWRIWMEYALVFCARKDEEILGAVVSFPTVKPNLHCLHKVFVNASFRGKGVGTVLFKALFARLDFLGIDCFLTVDPRNEYAIRLYETWGFAERRFEAGFYREDEDRMVLTRRFS